jgi:hypothetical protein
MQKQGCILCGQATHNLPFSQKFEAVQSELQTTQSEQCGVNGVIFVDISALYLISSCVYFHSIFRRHAWW